MLNCQKGFVPIIYIILVVVVVGGLGGWLVKSNYTKTNIPSPSPILFSPSPTTESSDSPFTSNTPAPSTKPTATVKSTPTTTPKTSSIATPTPTPAPKITCAINPSISSGWSPMTVYFNYTASDASKVTGVEWDLDGNGSWESQANNTSWTYKDVGNYEAKLRLKLSSGGYSDTCSKTITINPPKVTCNINVLNGTSGQAPFTVNFIYGAEFNGTNDYVTDVQWDFNGDGNWDTAYDYDSQHPPAYTFSNPGNYTAKMHLKTHNGMETDICTKSLTVN